MGQRYTTKEQEDIHGKSDFNVVKDYIECQKVKLKANCNKNWHSQLNLWAVSQAFSEPPKIPPARGTTPNKNK